MTTNKPPTGEAQASDDIEDSRCFLQRLKAATDGVIAKAQEIPAGDRAWLNEAINWGNLHCIESQMVISSEGYKNYRVIVEEASPGCIPLQEFIKAHLRSAGFQNVEVRTKW